MAYKVKIKLLPFGIVKDLLNHDEIDLELPSKWDNDQSLLNHLCEELWPALSPLKPSLILAINHEYVYQRSPLILHSLDAIALIPPINGV